MVTAPDLYLCQLHKQVEWKLVRNHASEDANTHYSNLLILSKIVWELLIVTIGTY
jgi:hypothetical protein